MGRGGGLLVEGLSVDYFPGEHRKLHMSLPKNDWETVQYGGIHGIQSGTI